MVFQKEGKKCCENKIFLCYLTVTMDKLDSMSLFLVNIFHAVFHNSIFR